MAIARGGVRAVVILAALTGLLTLALAVTPVRAQEQEKPAYAPVDRPGPALSVPADELDASLDCPVPITPGGAEPILLIPGTNLTPEANFSWNYVPAFEADGRAYCTVELPLAGMGDIQIAAEHVVHAMRTVAEAAGSPVDVVGYSQGGMIGRWALRFWPDTRPLVDDVIGLAPSNHGTETAKPACAAGCVPAYHQQRSDAQFIDALNSHQESFAGTDYTVVYTWMDEIVAPNVGPDASSPIDGPGAITNVALQEVCPGHPADHFTIGTTDPVAYALVVDALDHDGPADPARFDPVVCAAPYMPGVDPTTLPADLAAFSAQIAQANEETEPVEEEPPLRCYVTATCDPAPADDAPAAAPAPPADDAQGAEQAPATLPATGAGATGAWLAGTAWAAAAWIRRRR